MPDPQRLLAGAVTRRLPVAIAATAFVAACFLTRMPISSEPAEGDSPTASCTAPLPTQNAEAGRRSNIESERGRVGTGTLRPRHDGARQRPPRPTPGSAASFRLAEQRSIVLARRCSSGSSDAGAPADGTTRPGRLPHPRPGLQRAA
jgi:hypothetical protein